MASSSSNGKDPDGSESKTENPFIRFRQFADAQISSLLQGIVGLPSAFSKAPSSNTRWAEIDDKLQRRDELHQQSEQPDNPEAVEERRGSEADKDVEIPVKTSPGWRQYASSRTGDETDEQKVDGMTRDLPLYSPVSTSLFTHLYGAGDVAHHRIREAFRSPLSTTVTSSPDEVSLNNVKSLQYMILDQLRAGSSLQSDYSLLPYLLFSPYSPLRLSSTPSSTTTQQDNFPFCDAFEDLIRVSQGRPMATTWTRIGLPRYWLFHHPAAYAACSTDWVRGMQWNGLLQQGVKPSDLQRTNPGRILEKVANYPSFSPQQHNDTNDQDNPPADSASKELADPRTEEDMYERFLRMASPPASLGSMVESLFADIEKEFKAYSPFSGLFPEAEKKFKDLKSSDEQLSFSSLFSDIEKDIKSLSPHESRRAFEHILSDTDKVLATALTPEGRRELREAWSDKRVSKIVSTSVSAGPETSFEPDRVVSTSSTTEHIKNEDGSIKTSVTVWKRFADGSESMTSSTHTEDPQSEGLPQSKEEEEENKEEKKQAKEGRQGWFWK